MTNLAFKTVEQYQSLTDTQKNEIIEAAHIFMADKGMSQNELKRQTDISYLNFMLNGKFTVANDLKGTKTVIPDSYFHDLAEYIDFNPYGVNWQMVQTNQAKIGMVEMKICKLKKYVRFIIGDTGVGKSYLGTQFKKVYPIGTYLVICTKFDTISSLLDKILDAANIKHNEKSIPKRLEKLQTELWKQYRAGLDPMIILDEAENLKIQTMQLFKSLYDYLKSGVGLCFIGTPDILEIFEMFLKNGVKGFPQFYRRIRSGIRVLPKVNPADDFKPFFKGRKFTKDAQRLLTQVCDNYGTLSDYMIHALEAANGEEITAELVKTINNIA